MKLYAHGPRAGKTFELRGIKFVNGVAEHPTMPKAFPRYYGIFDYPAEDEEAVVQENETYINNEQEEKVNASEEDVEDSPSDMQIEAEVPDWKDLPWPKRKVYVKGVTGRGPKNMKEALELMGEE